MRKKLLSKTYLRDAEKYNLKFFFDDECYYCVKKIIKVEVPFILSTGLCLIDNGYYILEIIPKKEHYCIRVFFDSKKNLLEYYIDISRENGMDNETKIPYYDDLYTDITITNGVIEILDETELEEALHNNDISYEDYLLACDTKDKLIEEINNHDNKYLNMDLVSLLW